MPLRRIDRWRRRAYLCGMCVGSAIRADIRVSIQDRHANDRVAGHLATGILADGDMVLVPNPPDIILDPRRELEAYIVPVDLHEHSKIDAEDIWKIGRFALRGEMPFAVTGKLRHHSTYAAQIGAVDAAELASTLEVEGGDLWQALIRLGAIPPEIRDIDPALLERASQVERAQRVPRRTSHEYDTYRQAADGWCILFCFCHQDGDK